MNLKFIKNIVSCVESISDTIMNLNCAVLIDICDLYCGAASTCANGSNDLGIEESCVATTERIGVGIYSVNNW